MSTDARRRIRRTLITAAITALLLGMRHAGFTAILLAIPLAIWLAYSAYAIATKPERRPDQLIRVGIWFAAFAIVAVSHTYQHMATRAQADATVAVITRHLRDHGSCPDDLIGLGLDEKQLRPRLGLSYYRCQAGRPTLAYAATFIVFEMFRYDFDSRRWVLEGG